MKLQQVTYKDERAIRLTEAVPANGKEERLGALANVAFRNGAIEAEIGGEPGLVTVVMDSLP